MKPNRVHDLNDVLVKFIVNSFFQKKFTDIKQTCLYDIGKRFFRFEKKMIDLWTSKFFFTKTKTKTLKCSKKKMWVSLVLILPCIFWKFIYQNFFCFCDIIKALSLTTYSGFARKTLNEVQIWIDYLNFNASMN